MTTQDQTCYGGLERSTSLAAVKEQRREFYPRSLSLIMIMSKVEGIPGLKLLTYLGETDKRQDIKRQPVPRPDRKGEPRGRDWEVNKHGTFEKTRMQVIKMLTLITSQLTFT